MSSRGHHSWQGALYNLEVSIFTYCLNIIGAVFLLFLFWFIHNNMKDISNVIYLPEEQHHGVHFEQYSKVKCWYTST